jgi:hypothetical protein
MLTSRLWLTSARVAAALYAGMASGTGAAAAEPATPPALADLDLTLAEQREQGDQPPGWYVPRVVKDKGYSAVVDTNYPPGGSRSLRLQAPAGKQPESSWGLLIRSFDAAPYRGQRIRFRAVVKVEGAGDGTGAGADQPATGSSGEPTRAHLWMQVIRPEGASGFFYRAADHPITATSWSPFEAAGEVAADAVTIQLGVLLNGGGRAWLGAASVEAIGKWVSADEPARPLDDRGLENLVAFARLAGLVRYFHPSDQAAATDWNRFVLAGVQSVEKAAGPDDLAHVLTARFLPIAPTVRVFPTGRPESLAAEILAPPAGAPRPRVLAWRHLGLGLGMATKPGPGTYSSERVDAQKLHLDLDGEALDLTLPEPDRPLRVELGGGVSALVPLALYAGDAGTLPAVPADVRPQAPGKPEGFEPSGNDRATRLADVVLAWNVFEHFYPYFDVEAADWPAELRRALRSAATDRDERAFLDTLRRLVAALHDGHGTVFSKNAGPRTHLPLLWEWVEDQLVVTEVDRERGGGVLRGDVVTAIDGRPTRQAIAAEEELISAATPQWRRHRALDALLLGPPGNVRLELRRGVAATAGRPGGEATTAALTRSLPTHGPGAIEERRPDKIAEVAPGIWYVDVGRAGDADWKDALDRLTHAHGIVFDFRGYPKMSPDFLQHLTGTPLHSAQWHVPVILRPDREGMTFLSSAWNLEPAAPRLTARLAFVTDGRAISYAESCLGIVEHYRLGAIVGGPTAGTNGNVNPFDLPGGYGVVWTGMQVLKHDGSRHHGVGILPTVPASRTLAGIREGRDELLEKAIALLQPAASLQPAKPTTAPR